MKFKVTMKDPDTLHDAIQDAAEEYASQLDGLDADEKEAIAEMRRETLSNVAGHWFEYGEYLTVEIDTEQMTCEVVPRKKP